MKYFIIDTHNNILLRSNLIPEELPAEIALPAEDLLFDMSGKIGEQAYAFGIGADADISLFSDDSYQMVSLRSSYYVLPRADYFHACRASGWVYWERTNRFCPICGSKLVRHMDMGKKCTNCNSEHFPHLAPASIIRITRKSDPCLEKDDEILLAHARNFRRPNMYGLIAGFLEGGETLEECAIREVHEEVGIDIRNIKYFGSQPWPYPSGVMVGFTAEYASGEVKIDDNELASAKFFRRDALPELPDKMSIARQLIDDWLEK